MTSRIQGNQFKTALVIILLFGLFSTQIAGAQSRTDIYKGFMVNFGSRAFDLNSNMSTIDETSGLLSGGEVGLVFGNRVLRSKVGLFGYYSSGKNVPGTIDLYTTNASANFYPLALITQKSMLVEPYFTAGISYDQFKFFGYYTGEGDRNYSQAESPFLGKVNQINATVGAGLEIKLMDEYDFIHLFTEVRYGKNIAANASSTTFANTSIDNQIQMKVGVVFGLIH